MAYQVDRYNGTFLTSVEDGTIDTTTDLRLVGKNYAGYGEVQNENFLHLLENFSNTSPPSKALSGQLWYDSTPGIRKLKFYDGTRFRTASGAEVSDTAPSGLQIGDLWYDSTAKQVYIWSGTEYVLVGPETGPDLSTSAVVPQTVKDTNNISRTIAKFVSNGRTIAVVSGATEDFELNTILNPLNLASPQDFTLIKQGITLISSENGATTSNHRFWGTASNSDLLGGFPASNFLQVGSQSFDEEVKFDDPGFTLGNDNDLRVRIENNENLIFENRIGNDITFRITEGGLTPRNILKIRRVSIEPGETNQYDVGSETIAWRYMYANRFYGNLAGNIFNLNADVSSQTAVNTSTATTVFKGTYQTIDGTVVINGSTNQIGYTGADIVGTLTGDCTGASASAATADRLTIYVPSIGFPLAEDGITPLVDRSSVPIRNSDGDILARKFIGIADNADRLLVGTEYRSTSLTATQNTIAARDSAGDITANLFKGTATAARYADLAEKYLADADYEVGTVVVIGGEKEITASGYGDRAIGAVSENPAYMMNSELVGGTYVALKGRVPVKVAGAVKKGQRLIASNNGCATVADSPSTEVFAIALESSDDIGIKLIESVIL